jgi:excisionase family DNA binding protein
VIDPHTVLTPPEIARATQAPRDLIYEAIRSGALPSVRRGKRFLVGGAAVIAWLEGLGLKP